MNKLIPILGLLIALTIASMAQPPSLCTVTGTLLQPGGAPCASCILRITRSRKGGVVISQTPVQFTANSSGIVTFTAVQGSLTTIVGGFILGQYNFTNGVEMYIPTASTANLEELKSAADYLDQLIVPSQFAPPDATFITQTPHGSLSAEQALSLLPTGIAKITTGTGVVSTATPGTDYLAPNGNGSALTNLNASNLASGIVPDARFPAALPAVSGANLTSLNASNLASGTVPLARIAGLTNTEISGSAGIAYSKLALSGSIVNGDLAANTISNGKLAQIPTATVRGRTTAGTGDIENLTATQATGLLNVFVGDSGSGGTKGLVPAPASGDAAASKFLKADGSWQTVTSGGSVNPTDGVIPYRSNSTTFADSPVSRIDASTVQVSAIQGSASASGTFTLKSTSNATKGKILFGTSAYDETTNTLGIRTASPNTSRAMEVVGDIQLSAASAFFNGTAQVWTTNGTNTNGINLFGNLVNSGGNISTGGNVTVGAGNYYIWSGRSLVSSQADKVISFSPNSDSGGIRIQVGAPTISSGFGTSPSITTGSTDTSGSINVGTGGAATSGVINFNTTWNAAPFCIAQDSTNHILQRATATTTQLTITSASAWTASDVVVWRCMGAR